MDNIYQIMKASDPEWMQTNDGGWTKDPDFIERQSETWQESVNFANRFAAQVRAGKLGDVTTEREFIQRTTDFDIDEINFRLLDAARHDKQQRRIDR